MSPRQAQNYFSYDPRKARSSKSGYDAASTFRWMLQRLAPASVQWLSVGDSGALEPAGSPQSFLASSICSDV
jgi:hypothetical protein